MTSIGSPPRLWGKLARRAGDGRENRFTPTPVGKTGSRSPGIFGCRVHPHACGENTDITDYVSSLDGSPPRLWGKPPRPWRHVLHDRFTPTPVGKTPATDPPQQTCRVHPHACGENTSCFTCHPFFLGSPPRLWGKPDRIVRPCPCRRFTPTPVGKTARAVVVETASSGSPPRLWGKQNDVGVVAPRPRFTPTPVGKTVSEQNEVAKFSVHPHACGENSMFPSRHSDTAGSPPRLWGKQKCAKVIAQPVGFTPTPVGKTLALRGVATILEVHPHACGENCMKRR